MPHIIIKMYPGRTQKQKQEMADKITELITKIANCPEEVVSIAIEEISQEEWPEKVYKPDIIDKQQNLIKKPDYNPFENS